MNHKFSFFAQRCFKQAKQHWAIGLALGLCATALLLPLSAVLADAESASALLISTPVATPTPQGESNSGYEYTVQPGDSWIAIAARTGFSVAELQSANPQAIRRHGLLLDGEKLHIPTEPSAQIQVYVVRRGEGWGVIAEKFGISVHLLQAANPRALRPGYVLYRGERLTIPPQGKQGAASTTAGANSSATVTTTTPITAATQVTSTGKVTSSVAETPAAATTATAQAVAQANAAKATSEAKATTEAAATSEAKATSEAAATVAANATTAAKTTAEAKATTEAAATTTAKATAAAKATAEAKATSEAEATVAAQATTVAQTAAKATAETIATATAQAAVAQAKATAAQAAASTTAASPQATQGLTTTKTMTGTQPLTSTSATETCPTVFADYPDAMLAAANTAKGMEGLRAFLKTCGALDENTFIVKDVNGDGIDDVVVIYKNPKSTSATPETDLLILDGSKHGFTIGHRARAGGEVHLLATEDINGDKQPDVAWSVTTCGASTCFDTVEVYSWTGKEWQRWTKDTISMAYAQINLDDVSKAGQGKEIIVKGGVYGSVGAGPQRGRTEVWASVGGAPYTLQSKTYDPSNCLYHVVLDANEAFLKGTSDKFAAAEKLYTKAATDQSLTKCWVRDNELTELRSFSLFRLALVAAYQGKAGVANDLIASLSTTYPGSAYDKAGQIWKNSYAQGNDIGRACAATNEFAKNNPDVWKILADYGYANPSFTASDVCPVLDVEVPASNTITNTTTNTTTASQSPSQTAASTNNSATATPAGNASKTVTQTGSNTSGTTASTQSALGACPKDLNGYANSLTTVLKAAGGDAAAIEKWLRGCGAMDEKRGAFQIVDLNGDQLKDAVFLPTMVSDRGFGPNGTQGAVLIYHAQKDGSYKLVDQPEIYGQPKLLSIADLNDNGKMDVAWTVEGCSTFCVLETQIVSWDGKSYTSTIQPGAVIAVGSAKFEPVAAGDPGKGQQLVLAGGMSGTPEGGLAVPHTEIWQSIKGSPYQRIRWTYDRKVEGNDCLGLRLVEADVALNAAPALGYKPAIDLYTQSLDPKLKACSIFGMAADQELVLLQGLASFRLVQAHALSGDLSAAQTVLANLTKGQPNSNYTAATKQWLNEYTKAKDAKAACKAVQPIFDKNQDMWKITDHFGYNHPALAAEQVCYKP